MRAVLARPKFAFPSDEMAAVLAIFRSQGELVLPEASAATSSGEAPPARVSLLTILTKPPQCCRTRNGILSAPKQTRANSASLRCSRATRGELHLEETEMIKAKQTREANAATSSMSIPLASAFLKETERWMGVHTDFLTSMESMMA